MVFSSFSPARAREPPPPPDAFGMTSIRHDARSFDSASLLRRLLNIVRPFPHPPPPPPLPSFLCAAGWQVRHGFQRRHRRRTEHRVRRSPPETVEGFSLSGEEEDMTRKDESGPYPPRVPPPPPFCLAVLDEMNSNVFGDGSGRSGIFIVWK